MDALINLILTVIIGLAVYALIIRNMPSSRSEFRTQLREFAVKAAEIGYDCKERGMTKEELRQQIIK